MQPGHEPLSDILRRPPAEALAEFLRVWHGITTPLERHRVAADLPASLHRLHQVNIAAPRFHSINHLLPASQLRPDGDKVVFYAEEQWVSIWGIDRGDLSHPDPPVWCRENEPDREWLQDAPSVSVFLLQLAVLNAAMNPPLGVTAPDISPQEASPVLTALQELPLPAWHWPLHPTRFYASDRVVAFVCPNPFPDDPTPLSIWIGALEEADLGFLEPHLSDAWEYYTLED